MNAATLPIRSPVGDYDLRGHKPHRVYVGGFQASEDILFIKVGMTSDVNRRIKDYSVMIPGGLSFIYSATVTSRGEAHAAEKQVMCELSESVEFEAVGGEWFKCKPFMKSIALDALGRAGKNMTRGHICEVQPFKDRRRGRAKK